MKEFESPLNKLSSHDLEHLVAGPEEDESIRQLLRETEMPGSVSLTFEREPSFFEASTVEGDTHQTYAVREPHTHRIVGMGSRADFVAWINGEQRKIGYYSQMRVAREYQKKRGVPVRSFELSLKLYQKETDPPPFFITTIIEDNIAARRYLGSNRVKGFPTYHEREVFSTLALPLSRRRILSRNFSTKMRDFKIRSATFSDLSQIVQCLQRNGKRFQFTPVWTEQNLVDPLRCRGLRIEDFFVAVQNGAIVGCLAIWNQMAFKQSVVRGYSGWMRVARPLINIFGPLLGLPKLPDIGCVFPHAYLSHIAIDDLNEDVFITLVSAAHRFSLDKGWSYLALGFSERNPLLQAVKKHFRVMEYRAVLYTANWPGKESEVEKIDGRIAHPELAML